MSSRDSKFRNLLAVPKPLPDDEDTESAVIGTSLPPSPPPAPARATRPARRPGPSARAAVARARASSRLAPQAWVPYTAQLPDTLSARLARRLARDQEVTGDFQLGLLHYLNAAFAAIPQAPLEDWIPPDDPREQEAWRPPEAARWALAWRDRKSGHRRLIRSGSRLHEDTATAVRPLERRLGLLPFRALVWEVQAEALARVLDALDAE